MLRPGSIVLNCGDGTAQFGLDRRFAIRIGGFESNEIGWLQEAARRDKPPVALAPNYSIAEHRVSEIITTLRNAELLLTNPTPPKARTFIINEIAAPTCLAELPALSSLRPDGNGHQTLLTRAQQTVAITSGCRIGAGLALLLATAGVGRIIMLDTSPVAPTDLSPYRVTHLGASRLAALKKLVAAIAPAVSVSAEGTPDVVVSVEFGTQTSPYFGPLLALATPHLPIATQEASAEVGPFVLPNRSACSHCLQLGRAQSDASWPTIVASVAQQAAVGIEATVACGAISVAGGQVLSYLDGARPALLNRLAAISAPDVLPRLTEIAPHPDCGCISLPDAMAG